mgnify:CR=1 FL=1
MKYLISCQLYFVFINKKLTSVLHNAYAIMPVGRMKWIVRKGKRKAPEIRPSGAFLFRFGKGSLFLRLIVFYSSPSNYLQMK